MPIFDYHCNACGQTSEVLVRGSIEPACKHCGSTALERQVSLTAPQGTAAATIAAGRRAAAQQGHFSHYSKAERSKIR
jgi:putative FmdB family regulatory protein